MDSAHSGSRHRSPADTCSSEALSPLPRERPSVTAITRRRTAITKKHGSKVTGESSNQHRKSRGTKRTAELGALRGRARTKRQGEEDNGSEADEQIDERRRTRSPSTLSVVKGCMGIGFHPGTRTSLAAWSRDLYWSAAVTFSFTKHPSEHRQSPPKSFFGGGRLKDGAARRRNHFKPLCTGHRPYRGSW